MEPKKTAQQAADDQKERDSKSATDLWLIRLTGIIAIIAAIQTGVFAWQGIQLKKTVEAGELQRKVSQAGVDAANTANEVARQTGHAQVRAYLTCSAAKYSISGTTIFIDIALTNAGQSPARSVFISGELYLTVLNADQTAFGSGFLPKKHIRSTVSRTRFQAIHSGATLTEKLMFIWPISFEKGDRLSESENDAFFEWNAITYSGQVSWTDVFGTVETFPVFMTNDMSDVEKGKKTARRNRGTLDVFMKDNTKTSNEE